MQIVNLKIKMSRFGICSTDSPKSKAIYVPIAFISYKGNKPTKKKSIYRLRPFPIKMLSKHVLLV